MCGIVGYLGDEKAAPILFDGLKKLEYRGYDSSGIAVITDNGINIQKKKGRLSALTELLGDCKELDSCVGIGHTRWATHGKPSDENSHPHKSASGRFAVVHNGIIENYTRLKEKLGAEGVEFLSETDTEVVAHLLDIHYRGDFLAAVRDTVAELSGSYAIGIICRDFPDTLIAVRKASPLIVGLGEGENFIASDIPAFLSYTRKVYRLSDGEIVVLKKDRVAVYTSDLKPVAKEPETIDWDVKAAEKDGYPHFMIKEINEQPRALQDTVCTRIDDAGNIRLEGLSLSKEYLEGLKKIYIVACGSAYHVGIIGKYVIENAVKIPVDVDLASEFRYRSPLVGSDTLVVIISQSGETADTLAALREAKELGARVLSIVNVVGSSIANESDDVIYTIAGPEISVATTKAYSCQLSVIYMIAIHMASVLGTMKKEAVSAAALELKKLPELVKKSIGDNEDRVKKLAEKFVSIDHAYYIGRNLDYAVALEASLKLKEVSYVHSEAYAAGELKHGTISLIEEGTLVVALCGCERLLEKTISNIKEVKARGAYVVAVTAFDRGDLRECADAVIMVPKASEMVMPSLLVVPMQLLGYYMSVAKGCDVDKPRNLAKSVTVE